MILRQWPNTLDCLDALRLHHLRSVSTAVMRNARTNTQPANRYGCAAKRPHQEGVKIWLTTSVAQRSKAVSFSGWLASVELVGRGTSTEAAASLTTLRG